MNGLPTIAYHPSFLRPRNSKLYPRSRLQKRRREKEDGKIGRLEEEEEIGREERERGEGERRGREERERGEGERRGREERERGEGERRREGDFPSHNLLPVFRSSRLPVTLFSVTLFSSPVSSPIFSAWN
jgi:hypothetical protein